MTYPVEPLQWRMREMLEATEAEGGSYTTENVRRHVHEGLDRLKQTPPAS